MTLNQIVQKIENFIDKYKTPILIASLIILYLAYTKNIPPSIEVGTQSVFSAFGTFAISTAAVLFLSAIAMIFMLPNKTVGTLLFIPIVLIIAAVLLAVSGVGALLTEVIVFVQTIPGVILTVFVGLIILTKMKFFRMFT